MEHFFSLTPERMLDAVERALGGVRATGRCLVLNSMENRVYDLELEREDEAGEPERVVAKFYRPGRWSEATLRAEHAFLAELAAEEIPVAAPLRLPGVGGDTLAASDDAIWFALFPRLRGRSLQELDEPQLRQVGRLLGRIHNVGARQGGAAADRPTLDVATWGRASLATLRECAIIEPALRQRYLDVAGPLLDRIEPRLAGAALLRLHGDCHLANLLWNQSGPFFLDFDDMARGPAVQDVWMVVRGRDAEARRQRDVLLDGYEQMRAFDRRELRLVEPLRALRVIHFSAWIARRWDDPIFQRNFPHFPTARYWTDEVEALHELGALLDAPSEE